MGVFLQTLMASFMVFKRGSKSRSLKLSTKNLLLKRGTLSLECLYGELNMNFCGVLNTISRDSDNVVQSCSSREAQNGYMPDVPKDAWFARKPLDQSYFQPFAAYPGRFGRI
jgi:hypothetical protein